MKLGGSEGGDEGLTGGDFDVWPSRLAQALSVAGERNEAWRVTLNFGLVLPRKMGKMGGMALSDSRGIPRGPCAGSSVLPTVPRNPIWGPTTLDEGPGLRRPTSWPRLRVSMYSPGEGGLPILFALLGKLHHLDPLSLSLASSSFSPPP